MRQVVDYEYEELQRREKQQEAIKAEKKQELRAMFWRMIAQILITVILTFGATRYRSWLRFDQFDVPDGFILEAEWRELVEGYELLAEAFDGTYSANLDKMVRGELFYETDNDGDGVADVTVTFTLYGQYQSITHYWNAKEGDSGFTYEYREEKSMQTGGWAEHYSIEDIFKGRAFAVKEETLYVWDHTGYLGITVQDPAKGHTEARAEIERLLGMVRQEETK